MSYTQTGSLYFITKKIIEKKLKKKLVVARKPRPGEEIRQVSEVGGSIGAKVLIYFVCVYFYIKN